MKRRTQTNDSAPRINEIVVCPIVLILWNPSGENTFSMLQLCQKEEADLGDQSLLVGKIILQKFFSQKVCQAEVKLVCVT